MVSGFYDAETLLFTLDDLITQLLEIIEVRDDPCFQPEPGRPFRPAVWYGYAQGQYRKAGHSSEYPSEAVSFDGQVLFLRAKDSPIKRDTIDVRVNMGKILQGEVFMTHSGSVLDVSRSSGGLYEFTVGVKETRREILTAVDYLRDCLSRGDYMAWQQWCSDLVDVGVDLRNADLRQANLNNYDLCCADLTGADLTGADLTGANLSGANLDRAILESVRVAGTDFFCARLPKKYTIVVEQSGMIETDSPIYMDDQ